MTDRNVFAKMLYNDGHMNRMEMTMYDTWFGLFNTKIDYTIYVKTSVENCVERIKKRGREGESDIEKGYLIALEKAHEDWLNGVDEWCSTCNDTHEPGEIVVLDGNPEDHSVRLSCVDNLIQQNLD
jgi:deoxyadenosine/deoxycytidine kinase